MGDDGYPTDDELAQISAWPYTDPLGWFAFIRSCWHMAEWGWTEYDGRDRGHAERVFQISTGGWSGNESIIDAMRAGEAKCCWYFFWYASRRGGHYEFRVPAALSAPARSVAPPSPAAPRTETR